MNTLNLYLGNIKKTQKVSYGKDLNAMLKYIKKTLHWLPFGAIQGNGKRRVGSAKRYFEFT